MSPIAAKSGSPHSRHERYIKRVPPSAHLRCLGLANLAVRAGSGCPRGGFKKARK